MRLTRSVLLALFFLPALSEAAELVIEPVVFACLKSETNVMGGVLPSGKQAAARIFDSIGVDLRWSCGPETDVESGRDTIFIRLAASAPKHFRKGTLAYALPFAREGVRITVFYDRLEPILEEHLDFAAGIFGHILAHEIGHVLERVDSHAENGLMRAHWTESDFYSIKLHSFGFTPEDARHIRNNAVLNNEPPLP